MFNKFFLTIIFITAVNLSAQIETYNWQPNEVDYRLNIPVAKEYRIITSNFSTLLISFCQAAYYSVLSEYDGDNCPFHPSCSAFFVESVERTNIIEGGLMFADRFTRDINFFKGYNSYPLHFTGRFYDPVYKYKLLPLTELVELIKSEND